MKLGQIIIGAIIGFVLAKNWDKITAKLKSITGKKGGNSGEEKTTK